MGILKQLWSGPSRDEEVRAAADFATEDGFEERPTNAGVRVTQRSALQLSAVWACVRLLTGTLAGLPAEVVVHEGRTRRVVEGEPDWLNEPNPSDPTMTWGEYVSQITASLLLDGNAFSYVDGGTDAPGRLLVLDPSRVEVEYEAMTPMYTVRGDRGEVVAHVGPERMLHATWVRLPGSIRGLSPIEICRQGIGHAIAAEEFGSSFFGRGINLSAGIEIAGNLTDEQKADFMANLEGKHAGLRKAHRIGVVTGGAKFVTGLGVTNEQAQFLETRKFGVEDIARIFGVPPHMLGSQEPGASSYNSVEQRALEFRQYSVLSLVRRIEDPHSRLLPAGQSLRLNLEGLARADLKTRFDAYSVGVDKFLTVNEVRALEDLPPIAGGNVMGASEAA